ncbi:MAG: hypothetical protein U1B78_06000, partial [Dehalococcoidia bacterium]|nr:hypothetical protein [Dehalococcoidia bacterium]
RDGGLTMARKRTSKTREHAPEPVARLHKAVEKGEHWFDALLAAVARWEMTEEEVDGRRYSYLIGGEAFDWLLLAERLCDTLDGAVPADEREALLFFGRTPRVLSEDDFKKAIGDAKHRAHLNFVYGVAVEEALHLTVEEEVLKEFRSSGGWSHGETLEGQVYERIYGKRPDELLAAFREERALPPGDEISYGEFRSFIYWLFKFRVKDGDPARVASDTRKALAQISALEMAARRRAQFLASPVVDPSAVVDGEVVAHLH